MTNILLQDDAKLVENRLKQFEASTGCELLLVMANQCDPYPGAVWRFGLLGGFLCSLVFSYYFNFEHRWLWPVSFLIFSLLSVLLARFPQVKRIALSDWETDRECREKAVELFHTLGTSAVSHKVTAMILVSDLEKRIQILIDEKIKEKINQQDLDDLIHTMQGHFKSGHKGLGLTESIGLLEKKILAAFGGKVSDVNPSQLSDTVHFMNL